jgi:hypothetical protein
MIMVLLVVKLFVSSHPFRCQDYVSYAHVLSSLILALNALPR